MAVILDEVAGLKPSERFTDGLVAVTGGDPKLLSRQHATGKEQSQKDTGWRPFQAT